MTPELITAIIACLGALTAFLKARSDISSIKEERSETKASRDKDSQELHDAVMKHGWEIQNLKDMSGHRDQVMEQLQSQINALNTTLATTNVKLDTLVDVIKELKNQ